MLGNLLLAHRLDQLAQLHRILVLSLRRREEGRVQQAHARAHHRDLQATGLEVIDQLLQRDIIELEAVPDLVKRHLAVGTHVLNLGAGNRLAEAKKGQGQVDEAVLVLLDVVLAVDDLEQLKDDQAGDQRRGGGDGGNDLAGDELGLVPIGLLDLVVVGTQVAGGRDEVNVVVSIIILLKLDRSELEAGKGLGIGKLLDQVAQLSFIIKGSAGVRILKQVSEIILGFLFRQDLQAPSRRPES